MSDSANLQVSSYILDEICHPKIHRKMYHRIHSCAVQMLLRARLAGSHPANKKSYLHQAILDRVCANRLASVHGLRDHLSLVSLHEHNMLKKSTLMRNDKDMLGIGEAFFTSSIDSLTIYRVATTSRICPILWTRSSACSSAIGLHCGSRRWTRDAAVRSNLATISVTWIFAKKDLE